LESAEDIASAANVVLTTRNPFKKFNTGIFLSVFIENHIRSSEWLNQPIVKEYIRAWDQPREAKYRIRWIEFYAECRKEDHERAINPNYVRPQSRSYRPKPSVVAPIVDPTATNWDYGTVNYNKRAMAELDQMAKKEAERAYARQQSYNIYVQQRNWWHIR
jgi:hypothetical protein